MTEVAITAGQAHAIAQLLDRDPDAHAHVKSFDGSFLELVVHPHAPFAREGFVVDMQGGVTQYSVELDTFVPVDLGAAV